MRSARLSGRMHMAKDQVRAYAEELVTGILANQAEVDGLISSVLENFSFERLGVVDRNILRLGVYELLHTEVPRPSSSMRPSRSPAISVTSRRASS